MKYRNLLILSMLAFTACPYESTVELGTPIPLVTNISGIWKDPTSPKVFLKITNMTPTEMLFLGGEEPSLRSIFFVGRAFYSSVGAEQILNIQTLGDEKGFHGLDRRSFYFAKIRKTETGFCYRLLSDDVLKSKSLTSSELQKRITDAWANPKLFEDKESCMIMAE